MTGVDGFHANLDISVSAMRAERQRMDVVMTNIANASSTRTAEGGPYRRRVALFETMMNEANARSGFSGAGVRVAEVKIDDSPFIRVHQPGHPDADAEGYVLYPNVNAQEEMVDLISASRAYEANAAAFRIAKTMFQRTLEMGRA